MPDLNNPAERLEYWLRTAQSISGKVPTYKLWATVWDLDDESLTGRAELMRRASELYQLGVEVRRRAELLEPMGPRHLEHFGQVEHVLAGLMSMGSQNNEAFFSRIKDTGWWSLSLLSTLLASGHPHAELDDPTRDTLVHQTRQLIDAVIADADLSQKVREELVRRLRDVETALLRIQIVGREEVEGAVDAVLGCVVKLWVRGADVAHKPVFKGVFVLLNAITIAIGLPADYLSLEASPLGRVFELPGPTQD